MGTTGMAFQQVNSKEFRTAQEVSDLDPDTVYSVDRVGVVMNLRQLETRILENATADQIARFEFQQGMIFEQDTKPRNDSIIPTKPCRIENNTGICATIPARLQGEWNLPLYQYLRIDLKPCGAYATDPYCVPYETIREMLRVQYITLSIYIGTGLEDRWSSLYVNVEAHFDIRNTYEIFLKPVENHYFETTEMFEYIVGNTDADREETYLSWGREYNRRQHINITTEPWMTFYVRLGSEKTITKFYYLDIGYVVTTIGSLFSFLQLMGALIIICNYAWYFEFNQGGGERPSRTELLMAIINRLTKIESLLYQSRAREDTMALMTDAHVNTMRTPRAGLLPFLQGKEASDMSTDLDHKRDFFEMFVRHHMHSPLDPEMALDSYGDAEVILPENFRYAGSMSPSVCSPTVEERTVSLGSRINSIELSTRFPRIPAN